MSIFSNFIADLKSGKSFIYASWFARLALVGLILIPIFLFITIPVHCIVLSWIFSIFIIFLEFPFLRFCCRADSFGEKVILTSQVPIYRCIIYAIFSTIFWIFFILREFTLLIIPTILLSISALLFMFAVFRGETPEQESRTSNNVSSNTSGGGWNTQTMMARNAEIGKV